MTLKEENEKLKAELQVIKEAIKRLPDSFDAAGKTFKFVFPDLFVTRQVLKLGFGGSFGELWLKVETDDEAFKKFVDGWPEFIHTVIEGDSSEIDSLNKITYGEAMSIHLGFTDLALEVRRNSKVG